jgi:hypothetical protein
MEAIAMSPAVVPFMTATRTRMATIAVPLHRREVIAICGDSPHKAAEAMRARVREHVKERSAASATVEMHAEVLLVEHPAWGAVFVVVVDLGVAAEHPTVAAAVVAITGRLLHSSLDSINLAVMPLGTCVNGENHASKQ